MTDHLETGIWGERVAAQMLRGKGYRILGQRVKPDDRDELDIVARQGEVLVFVEVRTRRSEYFGRPVDTVSRRKRQLLSRGAVRYLKRLRFPEVPIRFDVVEVVGHPADGVREVRHIENAFPLDRRYALP